MVDALEKKVTVVLPYDSSSRGLADALREELDVEVEEVVGSCRNGVDGIVVVDVIKDNNLWGRGLDIVERFPQSIAVSSHVREKVRGALNRKAIPIVEKPDRGWEEILGLVRGKLDF